LNSKLEKKYLEYYEKLFGKQTHVVKEASKNDLPVDKQIPQDSEEDGDGKREWKKAHEQYKLWEEKDKKNKEEEMVREILKNSRILHSRVDDVVDRLDHQAKKRKKEKAKLKGGAVQTDLASSSSGINIHPN